MCVTAHWWLLEVSEIKFAMYTFGPSPKDLGSRGLSLSITPCPSTA